MAIPIYSPADVEHISRAGSFLWPLIVDAAALAAQSIGATTRDIETHLARAMSVPGVTPILPEQKSPVDQRLFGHVACICVNEEVVHSPPRGRILRSGDVVTIDAAMSMETPMGRFCADAATSVRVGPQPSQRADNLVACGRAVAAAALGALGPGVAWSAVAKIAAKEAALRGCSLVAGYCGHGIGRDLHEPPRAGFGDFEPDEDFILRPGMVLTVEPIVVEGTSASPLITLDDGWTVVTSDRRWSAHEECMVAITRDGWRMVCGEPGNRAASGAITGAQSGGKPLLSI